MIRRLLVAALSLAAAPALAQASAEPAAMRMTVEGPVLFNTQGMALYKHAREDSRSPKFAWQCTDKVDRTTDDQQSGIGPRPEIGFKLLRPCADKFTSYLANADAKAVGDYTIVKRSDGAKQWAYQGFPLYTSIKDHSPGELNGVLIGFIGGRAGGMMFAQVDVPVPSGLKLMRRAEGLVLAAADSERTVYTPRGNARIQPAALGGREDFKPITAPRLAHVSGDWSIIDTGLGERQYAYRGQPLYTAAASLNDIEIAAVRDWTPVVVVKAPLLPPAIRTQVTLTGDVFITAKGRTLYTYNCTFGRFAPGAARNACDDAGDPAAFMVALCGDGKECARRWLPYMAPKSAKPVGEFAPLEITYPMFTDMRGKLYPSDAPKATVWAYRGRPLFTYYEDQKAGDIWGDGVGGIWGSSFTVAAVPGRNATFFEP